MINNYQREVWKENGTGSSRESERILGEGKDSKRVHIKQHVAKMADLGQQADGGGVGQVPERAHKLDTGWMSAKKTATCMAQGRA